MSGPDILKQYDKIIWDFDGTLFSLKLDWAALKNEIRSLTGPVDMSATITELVEIAWQKDIQDQVFDRIAVYEKEALQHKEYLNEQALLLVKEYADNSLIISNNISETITTFFSVYKAPEVPYITRDMVRKPKPDLEGFNKLKKHLAGKHILIIGDSIIDEKLAAAAGTDFINISRI